MKITYTPPVKGPGKAEKKRSSSSTSGTDFEGFLEGLEGSGSASSAQGVSEVSNFLFLQEVSDEEIARQKAFQQGKNMVAILEQLHRDLLLGTVPEATLRRLEGVVGRQRESFTDPRLQALLDDIELRAAVELAKLERARPR